MSIKYHTEMLSLPDPSLFGLMTIRRDHKNAEPDRRLYIVRIADYMFRINIRESLCKYYDGLIAVERNRRLKKQTIHLIRSTPVPTVPGLVEYHVDPQSPVAVEMLIVAPALDKTRPMEIKTGGKVRVKDLLDLEGFSV